MESLDKDPPIEIRGGREQELTKQIGGGISAVVVGKCHVGGAGYRGGGISQSGRADRFVHWAGSCEFVGGAVWTQQGM